jgi:M6 family metalloprotease-like protein
MKPTYLYRKKKRIPLYSPFNKGWMIFLGLVLFFICHFSLGTAVNAWGDQITEQFKRLKKDTPEFQQKFRAQERILLKSSPELRKMIHRPNPMNVLENVRLKKLKRFSPEVAAAMTDTVKILAIRVDFELEDPDNPCTTGKGKFDLDGNGENKQNPDGTRNLCYDPPHGKTYFEAQLKAVQNYYMKTSDNKLYLDYHVIPAAESAAYSLPEPMAYYGDPFNVGDGLTYLLLDAIEAVDDSIDFSFGGEYDPFTTVFLIFHAGSMWQTDFFFDSNCDIPAVFIGFIGGGLPTDDGTEITGAVVYSETAFQDFPCTGFMQGGLVHEVAHGLGGGVRAAKVIPDLYDISFETPGMGGWSLMGSGNWNLSGLVPPHHDAWNSLQLRFKDPVDIDHDTTGVRVWRRGLEDTTDTLTKIVRIPINSHEYFLVENRYVYINDTTGGGDTTKARVWWNDVLIEVDDYDFSLPPDDNKGGLAIWHIDEEITAFGVDMEEADGVQNFQTPYFEATDFEAAFYGTPQDVFYYGNPFPTGDMNNVYFSLSTSPNTNANSGAASRIIIDSISGPDSMYMTFNVRYDWAQTAFPKPLDGPADVNSPVVADLDGDDTLEVLVVTSYPLLSNFITIHAWKSNGESYTGQPDGWFAIAVGETTFSSLAIGDITGDGRSEVVCGTVGGNVLAWHGDSISGSFAVPVQGFNPMTIGGPILAPLLLADVDNNSVLDVLVGSDDRRVYAWSWDSASGTPQPVSNFPINIGREVWTTPLVLDSILYILPIDGRLQAYNINTGNRLWMALTPSVAFTSASPVAGDMDNDGVMEIIVAQGTGNVASLDENGVVEWQIHLSDTARFSSPALADLDEDGYLDVVFSAGTKLYAFNKNGSYIDYFPIDTKSEVNETQSSPTVGDIDGDGRLEVLIGTLDDRLFAYHAWNGKRAAGFPLSRGNRIYSSPTLADIDKDGDIEVAIGADDNTLQIYDLPGPYNPSNIPWGKLHRNLNHTRVVPLSETPTPKPFPISLLAPRPFYSYPNPVTGSNMKVRYLLSRPADEVDIKIFNVAGDLVKEVRGKTGDGILETEINTGGMASGVYIFRIEAIKGSEKSVQKKKFAIMR